jgi:predicted HicB family RNase H-like nuclease
MEVIEHNGHRGSVEYSANDHVFHGRLLGIDDCITYEGKSVEAATAESRVAVAEYLETCREIGKEPERDAAMPSDLVKP